MPGMSKHRITTHGVWTMPAAPGNETPRLYALVSCRDADDVQERLEAHLSSPEFRADMEGFDISQIVGLSERLQRRPCARWAPNPDGLCTPVRRNVVLWTCLRTVSCPVPRVRSACGQTS
ncbi:NIPSNAP family protein [Streptomyces collinus]|uniref:NIPSNAP family protein n=1 Tax=Streptomyces collinus TaxID=42684 RepID=UPI0036EA9AA6